MTAYYSEIDKRAADWLENLILMGEIAPGIVDRRSIEDVTPNDLRGFTQCHFFAGIGGWSLALRRAGWPDTLPVWTGSCPCQPFSAAGKGAGFDDKRHLWPTWHWLIQQSRPDVIFGEQVANQPGLTWFSLVQTDLEILHYRLGAADLAGASVGAPHIRQRLYWVADTYGRNTSTEREQRSRQHRFQPTHSRVSQWLADQQSNGRRQGRALGEGLARGDDAQGIATGLESSRVDSDSSVGYTDFAGLEGRSDAAGERGDQRTPWAPSDLVWCRDGCWRPVEPGTFPLAHGIPNRVGRLRGYGNAIIPEVAEEFIRSYIEVA